LHVLFGHLKRLSGQSTLSHLKLKEVKRVLKGHFKAVLRLVKFIVNRNVFSNLRKIQWSYLKCFIDTSCVKVLLLT